MSKKRKSNRKTSTEMKGSKRGSGLLSNTLVALVAVAGALALGEIAVRILRLSPELKAMWISSQDSSYRRSSNPVLSFELAPDYRHPNPDNIRHYGRINSHGQRDKERSIEKPPGTRRVIVLGDSVVEGVGLELVDTLPSQLELLEGGKSGFEVLNFGVSGYCTLAEVELLEVKGLIFKPDIVFLVFVENDYHNFNREGLALAGFDRPEIAKQLFERSQLFRILAIRANLFQFGLEADPLAWNRRATGDNNVTAGIERLWRLSQSNNLDPMIVIWPSFLDDSIVDTQAMPNSSDRLIVEELAAMYGIPTVRLSDYFRRVQSESGKPINPRVAFTIGDEIHPSALGNRIAASALAEVLGAGIPRTLKEKPSKNPAAVAAATHLGRKESPTYAATLTRLGNDAMAEGQLDQAAAHYQAAVAANPAEADAHNGLGVIFRRKDDDKLAAAHFEQAVRAAPNFYEARFNLAVTLERLGEPREAVVQYRRALEIEPSLRGARDALRRIEENP